MSIIFLCEVKKIKINENTEISCILSSRVRKTGHF